jgi:hypothetical protein
VQHINQRVGVYSNILEEIKNITPTVPVLDQEAVNIKRKYEQLELVDTGTLPNPTAATIASFVLEKLSTFGRALLNILTMYTSDLARELRIEPTVTMLAEIEVGWSPKLVIGVERSGTRADSIG